MRTILALALLLGSTGLAQAADEFGPRFTGVAPAALGDYETQPENLVRAEEILQRIEPAAGNEIPDAAKPKAEESKFVKIRSEQTGPVIADKNL